MATSTQDDARAVRALTDVIATEQAAPGLMRVVTWSGEYHVDARDAGCPCPDKQHNDPIMCKHQYSAVIADSDNLPDPYIHDISEGDL